MFGLRQSKTSLVLLIGPCEKGRLGAPSGISLDSMVLKWAAKGMVRWSDHRSLVRSFAVRGVHWPIDGPIPLFNDKKRSSREYSKVPFASLVTPCWQFFQAVRNMDWHIDRSIPASTTGRAAV